MMRPIVGRVGISAGYGPLQARLLRIVLAAICCGSPLAADAVITVTDPVFQAGGDPADDGPVPSTTGDQTYPADTTITISFDGILQVDGGSTLTSGAIALDVPEGPGLPQLIASGQGTRVNLTGNLNRLDIFSTGSVQILDGAVVDASDATACDIALCNVYIGNIQGSLAALEVSGAGSRLDTINNLIVAGANEGFSQLPQSTATVTVAAGGVIDSDYVTISAGSIDPQAPTTAQVDITGAGSAWNALQMSIAGGANSNASVLLADGASITAADRLVVGVGGLAQGQLQMTTGAHVTVQGAAGLPALLVGGSGATGTMILDASTLDSATVAGGNGLVFVGSDGTGTLTLRNGSTARLAESLAGAAAQGGLYIGISAGGQASAGQVTVDGASSLLVQQAGRPALVQVGITDFDLPQPGRAGAIMNVQNGGTITIDGTTGTGFLGLGRGLGSTGTVNVVGAGSQLRVTGDTAAVALANNLGTLFSGGGGDAAMNVEDGGLLDIAPTTAGNGSLLVGAGLGRATLFVATGGRVNVDGELVIAEQEVPGVAPTGTLFIGTDGTVAVTGATRILPGGTLTGSGGTLITDTLELYQGGVFDGSALARVSAREAILHPGAALLSFNDVVVGSDIGTLTVESGGSIDSNGNDVLIGTGSGNTGALALAGGQLFADGRTIQIGTQGGTGTLAASDGAFVQSLNVVGTAPQLAIGAGGLLSTTGVETTVFIDGGIVVDGGELRIGSGTVVESLTTAVANGGRLTGSGQIRTQTLQVTSGGLLSPGQSPGTLFVDGDLTIDGGAMLFEIAGTAPGEYDVVSVSGNMTFNSGDFNVQLLNGFVPQDGTELRVLDVAGSLVVDPAVNFGYVGTGPDYTFSIRDVTDVNGGTFRGGFLTFLATDIAAIEGLDPNQVSMAAGLDELCPRVEGLADPTVDEADLDRLCGGLRNSNNTDQQIRDGLDGLTPEEITGTINSLLRFTTLQHGNLAQRINGLRYGAKRIDVSGLNLQYGNDRIAGTDLQRTMENLVGGAAGADEDFARWGFFGNGTFNYGDKDPTTDESGFDFNGALVTLGADYRVRDDLFVGGALGYNDIEADFDTDGGLDFQSMSVSLFGTWIYQESGYLDVMATWGTSETDTERRIRYEDAIGPVDRKATGDADGDQFIASIGGGWDFESAGYVFGPHAGANFAEVSVDGFQETGASGANLSIEEQEVRSLTANAGLHVSYTFLPSFGVLIPNARIDYVREFEDDAETINIRYVNDRFADDPLDPTSPIAVRTDTPDSDYVVWSVGASAQFTQGVAAFVNYRGTALMDDVSLGEVTLGLRLERSF